MDGLWLAARLLLLLGVANSAPIVAKNLLGTRWSAPLDAGLHFADGRPLLGPSKSVRGVIAAVASTALAGALLGFSLGLGAVIGAGAMLGDALSRFVKRRLGQVEPQRDPVLLAGIVIAFRTQMTRRGKMAIVTLDDGSTQIEVTVFNELWEAQRGKIKEDELLLVEGKVQKDDYSGGLRVTVEKLFTLSEVRGRFARSLQLTMNGGSDVASAKRLQALLTPFRPGPCPIRLRYTNSEASAELPLSEEWCVQLDDTLLAGLIEWLRPENVKILYN